MKKHLFDKVDIDQRNCHIPNGEWKKRGYQKILAAKYETGPRY